MRYFVSYARRDNSIARLHQIRALLSDADYVYIDDLEPHVPDTDRSKAVIDALTEANVFVAVASSNYLNTEWTRWEFETALYMKITMTALISDTTLVRYGEACWPWPGYLPPEGRQPLLPDQPYVSE
ncbi:toll/interleukin-1 receptor domain-containing protein [Streptomyces sp. NBC_00670]|uniref:toll/interleukin-1 receptor domain-containing protein n=1 Tax=Streptomyces sp. NBC_00670 TaxID=2975804 RepID=UPI003FA6E64D